MRIGLISDIHGNFEALQSVLKELDKMKVTEIYCLGDVVGYYSQVNECCEELIKRNIPSLMGNHDWYMASGGFCPRSKSVNDCLTYQRKVIKESHINWLRSFSIQWRLGNIHMVHGGWSDPIDEYIREPNEDYFSRIDGEYFISGHTHIQQLLKFTNGKVYCNPGSVGQPRDGDPRASFAVFEGNNFVLHRVEYNMQKVFDLMKSAGFDDYYYGCLKTGSMNLRKLD